MKKKASIKKDKDKTIKTFKNLIEEVHNKNLCGSCGGCVSFCSAHEICAIEMGKDGIPVFSNEDNCLECGICYFICPEIKVIDDDLREKWNWKPPIGDFQEVTIAQATDKKIRENATDGGVVTALLQYMLEKNIIDGAIVSRKTGNPFEREPIIATQKDDLLSAAGSTFSDLAHVDKLGKYNTYSPNLFALKKLKNMDLTRIAVVGTPCQIHTIRKMQILRILPSHIVKFAIGLFCMENFTFDQKKRTEFEKKAGINLQNVIKMNIKEDIIFTLKNGKNVHVLFEDIEPLVRPACLACLDFANDFADISVGGLGSPDGFTTTILRTNMGNQIFKDALNAGYLQLQPIKKRKHWSVERTKTIAAVINYSEQKRQRGSKRLKELNIKNGGD